MKIVNWGILAEFHNWVVVAFALLFWAALLTLMQPYLPGLQRAGTASKNAKTQSGGIAS